MLLIFNNYVSTSGSESSNENVIVFGLLLCMDVTGTDDSNRCRLFL